MRQQCFDYAVITPARDEAVNLRRLLSCLAAQTVLPRVWIIVDNASTDDTVAVAAELAHGRAWVRVATAPGERRATRGAPIVRSFHAGLALIDEPPEIVVKLDADVSMEPDYFERLLKEFQADESLGIASGQCYELEDGAWHPTHVTGGHVRGAARAYRWSCLCQLLPLEEQTGWDTIDELQANVRGWTTRVVTDLRLNHHRAVGERDGKRARRWLVQGAGAYYLGYRPSYLVLRSLHRARRDPAALAMILGFIRAAASREPRHPDHVARAYLRAQQRLTKLPLRLREASGRVPTRRVV